MLLDGSPEQELLWETTRRFVEAELPVQATRALHDHPQGFERSWHERAAELGWFSLVLPEAVGGGGRAGLLDAAGVAHVLGASVQPGPFVPTSAVAAAFADADPAGAAVGVLEGIGAGELVAAWACADERGEHDAGAGVVVSVDGGVVQVDGSRGYVVGAPGADVLLVAGRMAGEPVHVLVPVRSPGVGVRSLTPLDLSRRIASVTLAGVRLPADHLCSSAQASPEAAFTAAVLLTLADTVGAMESLLAMTVAYAKERVAFGRPIGSFQAVKHLLADQALALETSAAVTEAALLLAAAGGPGSAEAVHLAAAFVGEAGPQLAQQCLQVHGGIGFTWEHDLHLYLRRIESNARLYGTPSWHRERVCTLHGLGGGDDR